MKNIYQLVTNPNVENYEDTLTRGIDTSFACKTYIDKAIDNVDGDLTKKVRCSNFDVKKDKQDIQYLIKDSSGNETKEVLKL